ncbi:beta-galactosidase GalA [Xanthomonas translucens]|uniref:beta-galactosidase GalA n=4 Tax=Xanthomonas campestris pv. translucens TaxID=343 RepID=UPI0002A7AF0A|nr:beta-galactosidase GalA [Xanthomonas translucens]ELQ09936.1 beta-galactosidase [Xanthomonas translucens DAR61454]MCT8283826.1 DUF4982 domain-containing protein [Xanthomonas translucens pv. undulosa]MCT8318636.1 DUF4982 domain-containing protein [Xanthomonas translucens pv. undulosa]QSQ56865.1 DUF4982 domain-containing protein [Xanthomonas translucens pv. undulosa]UKE40451.1 DUF4982 domain-containing protein [Xanthomonas translucens pv. undulosa]
MQRREFLAGGAGAGLLLAAPALSWAGSTAQAGMAAGATGAAAAAVPTLTLAVDPGLLCLDEGWRFHEGDIPFPPISGQDASYDNAKAGKAWGAAAGDYDDSQWRQLRLPHDFAIEQPIEASANVAQGYRRRGIAWYRRSLRLDEAQRGKALELRFDGISSRATVWVNGLLMARSWSGYDGFAIDLSAIARYGQDLNSIAVRVDAEAMDGWWYEGAGIYRHTWLALRDALHIVGDGVHAVPRIGSDAQWTLPVAVTLANTGERVDAAALEVALYDAHGTLVAQGSTAVQVGALAQALAQVELQVRQPQRWDVAAPHLYRVVAVLRSAGRERDRRECAIGFRTLRFDAQQGFFLNERPLKIKGACLHQDHAGVGVAVPDSLLEFRIRRLKQLGCNAIRLHHAVASELLDVCDRLGMLVMAENRVFNPVPDYAAQLRWLVRRDRNHACVFLWSVFNEEPMQGTVAGYEMVRRAVALVRALDDSRPVTAAMNDGMLTQRNAADAVDVVGFNYRQFNYERVRAAMPHKPLLSSEDTSAFQTRGAWFTDMAAHVIAEDDSVAAPWGNTHRRSWKLIDERPYLAGGFVWTGFDYRGEPTPFEWPSVSSFFGIMDLCGFPKGAYWLRQAQWIDAAPVLQLLPHWNWPGREGTPIKVMAFCNAQQVELWLNGQSQGRQAVDRIEMNAWQVAYAPGVLEAVAYRDGREVARQRVQTVGTPVALRLTADRTRMRGDGRDAQPITLEAVDAQGRHVPFADAQIALQVDGGRLLGVGNGDPNRHAADNVPQVQLFNGLAQAIVEAGISQRRLRIEARAPGLRSAQVTIGLDAVVLPPSLPPAAAAMVVPGWRRTLPFPAPPDPALPRAPNDNNSWGFCQPGNLETRAERDGYVLYRTAFTPWAGIQQRGGVLRLGRATGAAQVYLDRKLVARVAAGQPAQLRLPPAAGERVLAVVMQVTAAMPFGFDDVAIVEY